MQNSNQPRSWRMRLLCAALLAFFGGAGFAAPLSVGEGADATGTGAYAVQNYASVGVFYEFPDSGRNVDYGLGTSYGYAWRWSERSWIEARLAGNSLETGQPGLTDFYQLGIGADYLKNFGKRPDRWFWLAGLGASINDVVPDSDDGMTGYANAGLGWRTGTWASWGVRGRAQARIAYDTFDQGQVDYYLGYMIEILPERTRVVDRVVEKEVIKEVVREVIREVEVPAAPPPDSDGDGVPDARDRCPETLAGAVVDADGCVREEQTITLPNIEFEFARAVLTPLGREQLEPLPRFLKDQPEVRLDIHGHTDSQGSEEYNQKLSEDRARAVLEFIVSQGIEASRLASRGFGESIPVADNDTLEGRARNRRVEVQIRSR